MSSIVRCKSGRYTYLYESESYRDEDGKPQNRRKLVGRVDPKTGNDVFKPEYLERVLGTERQPNLDNEKQFSINDIKASYNREYGAFHLLDCISQDIGLKDTVKGIFPRIWEQVLSLAYYMVSSGEPAAYCEDWIEKSESLECGSMSSQRISEMLISITNAERMGFYEKWGMTRRENEYFALDITSVSSYSANIGDVAWGYNRDKEKLPQVNICMLVGEKSRLPIFQVVYNGALKDVSTLKSTLAMASGIDLKNIAVVMDKGFFSKNNINSMLSDKDKVRFLVSLPFSMKFASAQVDGERKDIDTIENTINIGNDIIRGVVKQRSWNPEHKVYVHIFYNADLAYHKRNNLYGQIIKLKSAATANPNDSKYTKDFEKYLCIRQSGKNDNGHTVSIRKDVIEKELKHTGWMVAVSNFISDPLEAISIYRGKDVVEKGFLRLKNCLDLARLRVHSDKCMQNKVFIGFIALILIAHIHKVMDDKELYCKMTMKKLFKLLETLRIQHINGNRILYPPTLEHRLIFEAFGIDIPS